ncbi:MAG: hypothetical protein ABJN14_01880 [Paracoccaceae bacterium]
MRLTLMATFALSCASSAFAQDQEPKVTQLIPMSESFGELIDEGYDLVTAASLGLKMVQISWSCVPCPETRR